MSMVFPQVGLQRLLQEGLAAIKAEPGVLDDVFSYYTCEALASSYGQAYVDKIKQWFLATKIPVTQAWHLNMQLVPQISIKLATEQEDESKVAVGDFWGDDECDEVGTSPFIVMLDIRLHTSRNGDEVLWLYYIVNYIFFKFKRRAEALGLQLQTFNASDYARDNIKLPDNVYVRTIRFKTTVQNFWDAEKKLEIDELITGLKFESVEGDLDGEE